MHNTEYYMHTLSLPVRNTSLAHSHYAKTEMNFSIMKLFLPPTQQAEFYHNNKSTIFKIYYKLALLLVSNVHHHKLAIFLEMF